MIDRLINRERLTEIDRERKRLTKKERLREREKDGWLSPGLSSLHWWVYRL